MMATDWQCPLSLGDIIAMHKNRGHLFISKQKHHFVLLDLFTPIDDFIPIIAGSKKKLPV